MRDAGKVVLGTLGITMGLSLAMGTVSAAQGGREGEGDLSTVVPAMDADAYADGVYTQDEVRAMQDAAAPVTLAPCADDSPDDGTACFWDAETMGIPGTGGRDFIYFDGEFFYKEGN